MIQTGQLWFRELDLTSKGVLDSITTKDTSYYPPANQATLTDCTEHTFSFFNLITTNLASRMSSIRNCTGIGATDLERIQHLRTAYPGFDFEGKFVSLIDAYNLLPADSATIGILEPTTSPIWHAVIFAKTANNDFYLVDRQLQIKFSGSVNINHYLNTYGFNINRVGLYFVKSIPGGANKSAQKNHKKKSQKKITKKSQKNHKKNYKKKLQKKKSQKNKINTKYFPY